MKWLYRNMACWICPEHELRYKTKTNLKKWNLKYKIRTLAYAVHLTDILEEILFKELLSTK